MKNPKLKTIEKYKKLIKGRVWTKGEIQGFLKLLRSRNYVDSPEMKQAISDLEMAFSEAVSKKTFAITPEHSKQGIEYLQSKVVLKRRDGVAKGSGFDDCDASIIKNFSHFRFVGIHVHYHPYGGPNDYAPIFRIVAKNKEAVDYAPVHWSPSVTGSALNYL